MKHKMPVELDAFFRARPLIALGTGVGKSGWVESQRFVHAGTSLFCVTQDGSAACGNLREHPWVSFAIQGPDMVVQGRGRARFRGPIDGNPAIRDAFNAKYPDRGDETWETRPWHTVEILPAELVLREWSLGGMRRETYALDEHLPPSTLSACWSAVRTYAFTVSLLPVLAAMAYAVWDGTPLRLAVLPLLLAAVFAGHAGANLLSDYMAIRRQQSCSCMASRNQAVADGLLAPRDLLLAATAALSFSTSVALVFAAYEGWPFLFLGLLALAGLAVFVFFPRAFRARGLGEAIVGGLTGPLLVEGAYLALTGLWSWGVIAMSLPAGLLAAGILSAAIAREAPEFANGTEYPAAGRTSRRRQMFAALNALALLLTFAWIADGDLPRMAWLTVLALPALARACYLLFAGRPEDRSLLGLKYSAVQSSALYNLLLIIALLIAHGK